MMLKRLFVAAALAVAFIAFMSGVSHAGPLAKECNVTMPCVTASGEQSRGRYSGDGGTVLGGRPAQCAVRIRGRLIPWCGCWLGVHLGKLDRALWLARNWAHVGSRAAGPCVGCIAVGRHHVGIVTAVDGKRVKIMSGNDGGRVRNRWRTTEWVIAWRTI